MTAHQKLPLIGSMQIFTRNEGGNPLDTASAELKKTFKTIR
jgi:hypothetical protein